MRIAIIATGSRGDVEPYLALGKGLQRAGHAVRLVTTENFEPLVKSHGVELWPVAGNVQDVAQGLAGRIEKGNFLAILSEMSKAAEKSAIALAEGALAACQGVDLMLGGLGGLFVGVAIAEKLRLPFIPAYYAPFTPTRAYPSFLVPKSPPLLSGSFNRLSYHVSAPGHVAIVPRRRQPRRGERRWGWPAPPSAAHIAARSSASHLLCTPTARRSSPRPTTGGRIFTSPATGSWTSRGIGHRRPHWRRFCNPARRPSTSASAA